MSKQYLKYLRKKIFPWRNNYPIVQYFNKFEWRPEISSIYINTANDETLPCSFKPDIATGIIAVVIPSQFI